MRRFWGLEWAHTVGTARRAQLFYDHNGTEEFVMQSNYGAIVFNAQQNGNLGPNAAAEKFRIGVTGCTIAQCKFYACTCVQSPTICGISHLKSGHCLQIGGHVICCVSGTNYIEFSNWTRFKAGYGVYSSQNGAHFYPNGASDYGAWQINGAKNGWNGLHMCMMTVMANAAEAGLYNDTDNEWILRAARNAETCIAYNGQWELRTYSGGLCSRGYMYTGGTICSSSNIIANTTVCGVTCVSSPIVCATSCVYVGDNIKIQQGIGCSIVNDAADYWRWTLAGGNNRFYWHTNTADRMCLNENGQLCTTGAMCSAIVCATTCVDASVVYVCGSGKIGALTCSKSYFNTFGGTPGFLGGDTKHEMRVMNSAGSTNTGYVRFTTDSSANFGISVATCSSTTHRLCITTAGVVTAPHCFTTPISCATTCFSLSSGSNVTKICNSVGFTVVDSTEGLLVRDNSANVMEIRASGTKSYCNFNVCGSLSKASGCFSIPHPDPSKNSTHNLQHSFVESPTEGDNIYRWQVDTSNCASVITLPSYYRHLNKNDMVWVSPYKNFGAAYGEVTADQCCLIVCSNQDGCYNVLLIGTRKDEHAENTWTGPEVLKPTSSETGVPTPVHSSQL